MQFEQVSRREFVTLACAAAWPLAAHAQQSSKLPTIGFFSAGSAAAPLSFRSGGP
jgi:hypothetical protein